MRTDSISEIKQREIVTDPAFSGHLGVRNKKVLVSGGIVDTKRDQASLLLVDVAQSSKDRVISEGLHLTFLCHL